MKIGNRFFDTKNHTYIMGILIPFLTAANGIIWMKL